MSLYAEILLNKINRLTTFLFAAAFLIASLGHAEASEVKLTAAQVATTWNNINGALIVVGASSAIDDEWTEMFKAMPLEPADGKTLNNVVAEADIFRKKLNVLLGENGIDAMKFASNPSLPPDSPAMVYLNSGRIMDALILLLNRTDPLAFIAQYYAWNDDNSQTVNDAFAAVALANRRMDVYMKENGIEMPEGDAAEEEGS